MFVPISKILSRLGRTESYNLFDVETGEVSNWTVKELSKALKGGTHKIIGFGVYNRLSSYFAHLGIAGEDDGKQHYTVVKRKVYNNKTVFILVDMVGKSYEFETKELINFIRNGAVVAGVIYKSSLKVSSLIEKQLIK